VKQYLENAHQDIYEEAMIGHLPRPGLSGFGFIRFI
jgi:hypothetical protein